ncbi:MAG TPA: hypothetical protein VLA83_01055 [Candidatus Binatia bacterium]|nr:hypothetical protein [Candidatus Binatia bacterium]
MMNNLAFPKYLTFAFAVIAVVGLSSQAGSGIVAQDSSNDFSHVVTREQGGDIIKVLEVRGPSDTIMVGNTYEVRGTYKLASQDKALLMVNVTVDAGKPHESHPDLPKQRMIVEKGEGTFTLQFHMWTEGQPRVSFFPAKGGHGFAARDF